MYNTKGKHSRPDKKFLLLVGLLLFIIILMFILEITNTTHIFHKKTVPPTIPVASHQASSSQSKAKKSAATANSSAPATDSGTKLPSSGSSDTSLALVQPYGDFVSNHLPGQSGSGTGEQSVCDSTPGASCYIQFTNVAGGATTKLPAQTVGSDGSTIWSWDASTLTSGKWQVTAVATLNGQTKTTADPTKLEIQ